ncbi:flagellar associated protein [Tritrichomonas foetus]|uniref:Flagellar associated protein n=1 Tax=Tritrichomonas foetus TaxID=1144522 RepID=A0A1J4KUB2_9EUKA|nr:flagellar associated protein [Tritrichomonas foetus]|eukprot:OHT14480.1 flagellar associated protein [Tritrichomonas foetus]
MSSTPAQTPSNTARADKPSQDENLDNLDALDGLEKTFQNVISDIVTDKSLDNFRIEYEKIHAAFLASHANNAELVKKCKALNTEILANSTKVNSILNLSQDDQRTIAGLRFEFEKAWRMVELSQEKENKSSDVIEQMKQEISNLSKLVETGGAMSMTQETSLQSIQDEIYNLKKEMKLQSTQIEALNSDYQSSLEKRDEIFVILKKLNDEHDILQAELDDQRVKAKAVDHEADSKSKEMNSCKYELKHVQDEVDDNIIRNTNVKKNIASLNSQMTEEIRSIREENEAKKEQNARLNAVNKLFEDKKRICTKILEQQENIKDQIKEKEKKKIIHMQTLNDLNKNKEKLESEAENLKIERKELDAALNETHQQINKLRGEIYKLTHNLIKKDSQIAGTNRSISLVQRQNTKGKNEVFDEKKKIISLERQRDGIESDLLCIKTEAHKNKMAIENVKNEIEKYSRDASDNRSNLLVIDVDKKMKEEEILELDKILRERRSHIAKQNTLAEAVLQQRDFLRQQVELVNSDCVTVESDNKTLVNDIRGMKELIRQKDTECVSAHLKKSQIETNLIELRKGNERLSISLKEAVQTQCTLENRLMRSRYLRDVALNDLSMLKRVNERLESDYRLLELSIHKKSYEAESLQEKCRILYAVISGTAHTYSQEVRKVDHFKRDLAFEIKRLEKLRDKTHHQDMLKLEALRLEKIKLLTEGKAKALEEELETPMNVHRWRFLEGTNPEAANLIKMTHVLRSKLIVKLTTLTRYKETLKQWGDKIKLKQKHIQQATTNEHQEAIHFFDNILRQKTQQLEMLTAQIDGQHDIVDDSRGDVDIIRQQLRDVKVEYYKDKKVVDTIRASSQMQRKPKIQTNESTNSKYIGGGFAVAQTQKSLQFTPAPKTLINITSTILQPKVTNGSKGPKFPPKGWNPTRKPLKPLLPTVAELDH